MKQPNLTSFKDIQILVIGDLMIDEYLWGNVDRISPEAPVPVVAVKDESYTLGGAGNVINNLVAMGASVFVAGTAGTGTAGKQLISMLRDLGVDTRGIIEDRKRPTTKKTRVIASNQQVLRIDRETRTRITSDTLIKLTAHIEKILPKMDLVLISDYDKGLITRELILKTTAAANTSGIITIADPKGMDFSKYRSVSVLTPNRKEAGLAAGMEIISQEDLNRAGLKIMEETGLKRLLITCGKDGMLLFDKGRPPFRILSEARQVFDVSGAGDTVIAILGLAMASGADFKESASAANAAAGIVVAKVGTATVSPDELETAMSRKTQTPR